MLFAGNLWKQATKAIIIQMQPETIANHKQQNPTEDNMKNIILDTDIGIDIDDTWALGFLLNAPELKTILVTTATGNTAYRAKIAAKFLVRTNNEHVPVGVGLTSVMEPKFEKQRGWTTDFKLSDYKGTIHFDGIQAMIDAMEGTDDPTLIAIGPLVNVAEFVKRRPDLVEKTNFIAMAGSIAKQLMGRPGAIAEWNVLQNIPAAQAVFSANWKSATITPLDTCAQVVLDGEHYQLVKNAKSPVANAILQNFRNWLGKPGQADETASSILFDTVAIFLAYSTEWLEMKTISLIVDDQGFTKEDNEKGKPFNVAINWLDLNAYKQHLASRLSLA